MANYKTMPDDALIKAKQVLDEKRAELKEEMLKIAAEQERRAAKAKIDALSPAERDYLKQSISAESIKSTAKVHDVG